MNIHSKRLWAGLAGALCLVAFVIAPVSAGMGMGAGNGCAAGSMGMYAGNGDQIRDQIRDRTCDLTCDPSCDQRMESRLAVLEEQGVDVTKARTAFASGDRETIRGMLGELRGVCVQDRSANCFQNGLGPRLGQGCGFL